MTGRVHASLLMEPPEVNRALIVPTAAFLIGALIPV